MAENNEREKQKRPTHLRKSFKITIAKSISNLFGSNVLNVKNSADTDSNSFSGKEMDFSSPGSRSNNNEQIHSRLNSISETSTHVSIKSVDAEIESYIKNLLQDSESDVENLPILIPNDGDNFMIEGYISQHDNNLFLGKDGEYLIHDEEIIQTNRAYVNYSKNFYGKEHFNFVGRYENNESVNFVLSVRYDNEKFECIFRYVI
ncbi:unnamed protein product [Brachionus calyciflorus]|uniref:Uncharacterized protein n=1 Tax=Brachionus calyciflorus TaxID=104777 RepID=A0A813XRD2_9BILA|nr:unnamed protein product [Brachionus calyciflorus]